MELEGAKAKNNCELVPCGFPLVYETVGVQGTTSKPQAGYRVLGLGFRV